MDINYELYKVFYHVAVTLSFSEASKQLFISQSAVSQSIKVLEKKLNQNLFIRSTKKVQLTPEGEILSSSRRLLTVEDGARGLMQSQGLFQHVKNLPQMVQNVMADVSDAEICAVCASTRPRPAEDSYMPVFRAGESQARAAAS